MSFHALAGRLSGILDSGCVGPLRSRLGAVRLSYTTLPVEGEGNLDFTFSPTLFRRGQGSPAFLPSPLAGEG